MASRPIPFLLLSCLLFPGGHLVAGTTFTAIAPTNSRIACMGRIEMTDTQARMGFPGVTIRFKYRGPAPVLRMSGASSNCFFNLSCNGWNPVGW